MYAPRTTQFSALRNISRPRLRFYRLRAAILKILNAFVVASMLISMSGTAAVSASSESNSPDPKESAKDAYEDHWLISDATSTPEEDTGLNATINASSSSQTTTEECLTNHWEPVGPIDTIGPIYLSSDDPPSVWNVSGWFRKHGSNEASHIRVYILGATCLSHTGESGPCERDQLYFHGFDPNGELIQTWGRQSFVYPIGVHNLNKVTVPKEFTRIEFGTHAAIGIVRIQTVIMASLYNVCGAVVEPRPVDDYSIFSSCDTKYGWADPRECPISGGGSSQGNEGDPINTRTGGFDYSVGDFSLSTPAGPLVFQRSYNSLATDLYASSLGVGWTHNHDVRLIFPDDPGGEEGIVRFKGHTANMYRFEDHWEGIYIPYPGVHASLTRDEGPPLTYSITTSTQTQYSFDEDGKLLEWSDAEGRSFVYSYDASGRLTQVAHESGTRYLTFSYDAEDRIATVEDHTGRQVSYGYDASGDLVSYTDPLGQPWTYIYDSEHHITEIIDPRGITVERTEYGVIVPSPLDFDTFDVTSYAEDQDIDSILTIEDDGATLHIVGNGWKQIDFPYRVNPETVIEFDFRSTVEGEVQGIGLDNDTSLSTEYLFQVYGIDDGGLLDYNDYGDSAPDWKHYVIPVGQFYTGDMNHIFFANDHDVENPTSDSSFSNVRVYDTTARALRQYNGEDELIIELAYNDDGTSFVDALGNTSSHSYDDRNTLAGESDALGNEQSKSYDNNFRPTIITDEDGDTTELTWSEDGANLTQVIDAEGNPVNLDYDENNNLTSVVDPLGAHTTYTYDGSLLTSSTDDAGNTTSYTYTPEGYLESVTDADGNTTSYTYDSYGQRASMTDSSGNTWLYRYDGLGRLEESEDPSGVITRSEYDAAGRLIRSTRNYDPARPQNDENLYNIVSEYVYDAVGNQIEVIDTFGRSTQYVYDDANRLITTIDPAGVETTNTYNDAGQLIASTDALDNTTTYVYDELGRLVETHDALGNVTTTVYNPDGTVASTSDALGNSTSYVYDDLKRVVATTDALGNSTTTQYDAAGNVVSTTDSAGRVTMNEYDQLGRLVRTYQDVTITTGQVIGEVGRVTDAIDHNPYTIILDNTYTNPVIFAAPVSLNGADPVALRITNVQSDRFTVYLQEPSNLDGVHGSAESLSYVVFEAGTWEFANGLQLEVGKINTSATVGKNVSSTWAPVAFSQSFDSPPAVLTQIQTVNDSNFAATRQRNTTGDGFELALEGEEANTVSHGVETVGWMAIEPGMGTWSGLAFEAGRTADILTHEWQSISFSQPFSASPRFVASIATYNGSDSTTLRYDHTGLTATNIPLMLSEDTTDDSEIDHNAEGVHFLAIEGNGSLTNGSVDLGEFTQYVYDELGNRIQTIDPRGHSTHYAYDEQGRLETVTDALGGTTTYTYDALGNRLTVTDAEDNTTSYVYDDLGRQVSVTDPLGNTTSTGYNALGNALSRTDANGETTTYVYDNLGRLETQIDPLGGETSYTYDDAGNQLTVTDAEEHTTTTVYDELNRPVSVTDPLGNTTTTTYDAAGNVVTTTDGSGQTTTFTYDDLGRQETVSDPLGDTTTFTYDSVGNRVSMTDAEGVVTRYEYDALNHLTAVIENYNYGAPADHQTNVRTEYSYDANGNRLIILDGRGHTTTFSYDALNRLESEADPLGNTTSYGYDAVGKRTSLTDAEGFNTSYVYDDAGRLTTIDYPDPDADVSFTYDEVGNRLSMSDGAGSTTWVYDELGRVTSVTDPFGDTVSYAYDAVGNRVTLTYPDGKTVSYNYDSGNRLDQVTDWDSGVTDYSYDSANRLETVTLPNDVVTTYTYDEAGQLLKLTHEADGTLLSSFTYTYDSVGNRTRAQEYYLTPGGGGGPTVSVLVVDERGDPMADLPVYAFDDATYTGYHETTDENGEAAITLPEGEYRFRVDVDGTQFWSGETNHCTIAGCTEVLFTIPDPVLIRVQDTSGTPMGGLSVYVFDGMTYTGVHAATDVNGEAVFRLIEGSYRFRVDLNGTQFWSGESNHCAVPGCTISDVSVTVPVTVSVADSLGMPAEGIPVYAFSGGGYSGYHGTSDAAGQVTLTLPQGDYRFRADSNGTQFWSGETDHCAVPDCSDVSVIVTLPVTVTVLDTDGQPAEGLPVYAFDDTTYTGFHATTDENGQISLTLPAGEYRFRADKNGTQFWSAESNHCTIPGCTDVGITVTLPVTVTVLDTDGQPAEGLPVYAFDESTYTGYHAATNAAGEVQLTLPLGDYRFRADKNGTQFWSAENNHCAVPGCSAASVIVTLPVIVTVLDTDGQPAEDLPVYAFDDTTYSGFHATTDENGQVSLTLPQGDYRFRADYDGTQYWSGEGNHCTIPGCASVEVVVGEAPPEAFLRGAKRGLAKMLFARLAQGTLVVITVLDTDGQPAEGLPVYAFDESVYAGVHGTTDVAGQVSLDLPDGDYRFRADYDGTQFWSGGSNYCTLPGCTEASITVTLPVTITVSDTDGAPAEGLPVYAFDESTYTGFHATTDATGQVSLTLPQGDYRFRADKNGTQFWSGETNHCTLPGCTEASITVTLPVAVTVLDTDGQPAEGLPVYAFDETIYTGYHATTDAAGQVSLTLPQGEYRFRSDKNGTHFWSGAINHCTLPGCTEAGIIVTIPVTVTVQSQSGDPYPDLPVYAFSGEGYTGFHGTTDENGQMVLTLPQGDYHFRADFDGVHFWSGETDHCVVPGCLAATVELPGGGTAAQAVTIDYTYDPLYRLTAADYDSGEYFHYTYDEVGNRLTQETQAGTNAYTYDNANRLIEVDGASYSWSANGNLLSDGESTYTYDHANRLSSVAQDDDTYSYTYNGLGDRLSQTVNGEATNYTLDTVTGLTQVLDDGTNVYLYGLDRVGEGQPAGWAYHIPDALGSVRQLTDADAGVTLARAYEPFGSVMASSGLGETSYSYTGEWADGTGLVHLRARYYAPWQGRFLNRDEWNGSSNVPISFNKWLYVNANPVNISDPSGNFPQRPWHPPIAVCAHCYLIMDPEARKTCLDACICGIGNKECPAPTGIGYGANKTGGGKFVELIRDCPGWWDRSDWIDVNNSQDLVKLTLAYEVLWESNRKLYTGNHFRAFMEAVAHRYWEADYNKSLYGLNWMLGGSQSVIQRVNNHHRDGLPFDTDPDITSLSGSFTIAFHAVEQYVFGIFNNQRGSDYQTRPYEWGNPPKVHQELLGRKKGVCPGQIYSISDGHSKVYNNDQCVLTFHQERCITDPAHYDDAVCSLSCEKYKEKYHLQ